MSARRLSGVCAATITPLDRELRPDASRAIAYYGGLLARGCDALNVLGTTGEAMSLSLGDRLRFMEALAGSLPSERMMAGTGAAALGDAIRLTECAFACGFGAALVMPPFFFRDAADDGVMRFFDRLFAAVGVPPGGVFLYNFPLMSGIRFHPDLVDRLRAAYPGLIGGFKDSSNDAALQREVAARNADLRVFPSSEAFLGEAREAGYAGCISGSVALWPELAARVWAGDGARAAELRSRREALRGLPLIAAVRYLLAQETRDAEWERCAPPLVPLSEEERRNFAMPSSRCSKEVGQ